MYSDSWCHMLKWHQVICTVTSKTVPMFGSFVVHIKYHMQLWEYCLVVAEILKVVLLGYISYNNHIIWFTDCKNIAILRQVYHWNSF